MSRLTVTSKDLSALTLLTVVKDLPATTRRRLMKPMRPKVRAIADVIIGRGSIWQLSVAQREAVLHLRRFRRRFRIMHP